MAGDVFSVADRTIVITGGLGQLGQQYAAFLLQRGAKVALLDASELENDNARQLVESNFGRVIFMRSDVTSKEQLNESLAKISTELGVPFGLINNAALDSPPNAPVEENGPFEAYPEASWDKVMDVNVKGVFLSCQVFGAAMAEAGEGAIVNICSTYGLVSPDQGLYDYRRQRGEIFYKPVAYCASKSALLNMTRYLATYWGERNVRVNTLTLGGVFNNQDATFLNNYRERTPLKRMAREDEYNGAIVFLLSAASGYMTGSNMIMDGGWTAW